LSGYGFLLWVLLLAVPPGLVLAGYWARGRRRADRPQVPPGDPENPV